jgi:hypothetical protein
MLRFEVNITMTACEDVLPPSLTACYNIMRENNASET